MPGGRRVARPQIGDMCHLTSPFTPRHGPRPRQGRPLDEVGGGGSTSPCGATPPAGRPLCLPSGPRGCGLLQTWCYPLRAGTSPAHQGPSLRLLSLWKRLRGGVMKETLTGHGPGQRQTHTVSPYSALHHSCHSCRLPAGSCSLQDLAPECPGVGRNLKVCVGSGGAD